jgi:hypothetical protein
LKVDELITELVATGAMNEDTLTDLERMRAEYAEGKLDPDDETYLRALHARVMNMPMPEPVIEESGPVRLDGLTIEDWRDRALRAEERLATLEDAQAGGGQ